ncbi:MAG: hypothetical protein AMXMBFR75_01440 [Candidatus Hinthialibacteria bacterium]
MGAMSVAFQAWLSTIRKDKALSVRVSCRFIQEISHVPEADSVMLNTGWMSLAFEITNFKEKACGSSE